MTHNDKADNFLELFQSECVKNRLIDEQVFLGLYSEVGASVLSDIVTSFCKTLDESFASLQTLLSAPDTDKIYRVCHKLKGSSQLIGFMPLGKLCEQVCAGIKSNEQTDWSPVLKQIVDNLAAIKEAIIIAQNP